MGKDYCLNRHHDCCTIDCCTIEQRVCVLCYCPMQIIACALKHVHKAHHKCVYVCIALLECTLMSGASMYGQLSLAQCSLTREALKI